MCVKDYNFKLLNSLCISDETDVALLDEGQKKAAALGEGLESVGAEGEADDLPS